MTGAYVCNVQGRNDKSALSSNCCCSVLRASRAILLVGIETSEYKKTWFFIARVVNTYNFDTVVHVVNVGERHFCGFLQRYCIDCLENSHGKNKNKCLLKSQATYQIDEIQIKKFSLLLFYGRTFCNFGNPGLWGHKLTNIANFKQNSNRKSRHMFFGISAKQRYKR